MSEELKKLSRLLPLLLLLVAGAPFLAADSDETADAGAEDEYEEYVEVNVSYVPTSNTITTRLPLSLQLTPANVGAVSAPLFREQDAMGLSDALKNVSGLNIQTQSGVHDFYLLRGFDSLNGSLLLLDGAPEPEASYYHLYNVEGVEVLKGTGGFLYGKDPLAGAINVVREQPVPNEFLDIGLSAGSWGSYEGTVDWNTASDDGKLAFRLNTLWLESDGYRDDKESQHWAINPSFAWQISDRSKLNLNIEYVDLEYSPDAGLPLYNGAIPDVDRKTSYQSPLDFSEQEVGRIQLDYEIALNDRWSLRNKTYYRELDWTSAGTQLFQAVDVVFMGFQLPPIVPRVLIGLDDSQQYVGNRFEAVLDTQTGRVKHNLIFGLELANLKDDFDIQFGDLPVIDLFDPVDPGGAVTSFPFVSGDADSDVLAPYVIDQMQLSERFHLLLGGRYDDIDFSGSSLAAQVGVPLTENRDDGDFSPMIGLTYAHDPTLSLYGNAGEAFAPPASRVIGGDFQPEESQQVEVGVKKTFLDGKMRTTFALYQVDRENIGIPDDNGVTQQLGDQESRGFEFEFAAEPRPRLRTFLSYAYNDSELKRFSESIIVGLDPMMQPIFATVDRSGNTPAFAPEHLLNLWVSQSFRNRWSVAGGARFIGDQFIAEDNAFEIDSALVLDATVSYTLDQWRLKLNLKNLTDEEYEIRGFGSDSVIPANAAAVYLSVDFRM